MNAIFSDIKTAAKHKKLKIGINELDLKKFKKIRLSTKTPSFVGNTQMLVFHVEKTRSYLYIVDEYKTTLEEIDYIEISNSLIQIQTLNNNFVTISMV